MYVYVSVSKYALSAALVVKKEEAQQAVYLINHTFREVEKRYSQVEKMVFALVMASRLRGETTRSG